MLLLASLALVRNSWSIMAYWAVVAVARTTGTAIGDLLAESRRLHLGLTRSTFLTGAAFVLLLVAWRRWRRTAAPHVTKSPAQEATHDLERTRDAHQGPGGHARLLDHQDPGDDARRDRRRHASP